MKVAPCWQLLDLQCPVSGRGVTRPRCSRRCRNCVIVSCQAGGALVPDVPVLTKRGQPELRAAVGRDGEQLELC